MLFGLAVRLFSPKDTSLAESFKLARAQRVHGRIGKTCS